MGIFFGTGVPVVKGMAVVRLGGARGREVIIGSRRSSPLGGLLADWPPGREPLGWFGRLVPGDSSGSDNSDMPRREDGELGLLWLTDSRGRSTLSSDGSLGVEHQIPESGLGVEHQIPESGQVHAQNRGDVSIGEDREVTQA